MHTHRATHAHQTHACVYAHTLAHDPLKCQDSSFPDSQPTAGNTIPIGPSAINVFLLPATGEFGAVMEGQLNQDDSILKVAVKTMKSESVDMSEYTCSSPGP